MGAQRFVRVGTVPLGFLLNTANRDTALVRFRLVRFFTKVSTLITADLVPLCFTVSSPAASAGAADGVAWVRRW